MLIQYDVDCPSCGYHEPRLENRDAIMTTPDGNTPTAFGEEVSYPEHQVKNGNLVATGKTTIIILECPNCEYKGE